MLIKSVELKNIKSYSYGTVEFLEGINGICGQNGHGKTTVLEAIGYALFDYPPYKKISDFLRHGEKSGYVTVTVEGNDEIEYTVHRKIGGNDYYIRTIVGEIKGKKDISEWIAGNLFHGLRADELPSVFENAIGVPQGTFTTAFLLNPEPRKKVFDDILGVEEYKAAYANLRPVINAIEKSIDLLQRDLIPLHTRTEKYPELKKEKDALKTEIDALKANIKEINANLLSLTRKKEELANKKAQLDVLSSKIGNERIRLEGIGKQLERANSELLRAEAAQKVVNELTPAEESFKKENISLKGLNNARLKRDRLKEEIARLDFNIKALLEKLDRSSRLSQENKGLEEKKRLLVPKIETARELEESIRELQKELKDPMADIILRLLNLRDKLKRIEEIAHEIDEQKAKISSLLPLKNRQLELETRIKDLKDIEISLRELSSEVSALKEKELQAEKLRDEISALTSRKSQLAPIVESQKLLENEIKALSAFLESLTKLGFELRKAVEREQHADALSSEIAQLESNINAFAPLIEKQTALETRQQELNQQHAALSTLLKQTRSNIKLAGKQGLCPILSGVKCTSVTDFAQYFNDELNSRKKELKKIEGELDLVSKELKQLNNPRKQSEDMTVLTAAKKKDISAYEGTHEEVRSCRKKLEALALSYPLFDTLNGSEDEQRAVSLKLLSTKEEFEKNKKSVTEFERMEALIASKNKDLENFSDIPSLLAECHQKIKMLNSKFNLSIELDKVKAHLESIVLEIKSREASLKDMNDPAGRIAVMESLIESKHADINSLKDVPRMISACLKKLEMLNTRFHLKDRLDGNGEEIKLVDELMEAKNRELKALNSPDKEFEKINEIIEKNLAELKALEQVPESLESCRRERDDLNSHYAVFSELDEKIASLQDKIAKLEPEHNKYLQALPSALKVNEYTEECRKLKESMASIDSVLKEYTVRQNVLLAEFSETFLNDTISQLEYLGKIASGKAEEMNGKNKSMEKLSLEIAGMESELLKIKEIERKLENEKQFLSFSVFIRDTIKNSSEHIVNEFIGEISQEAGNIYCEIMEDYTCTLKWLNDYDIEIESGGDLKLFKQLSGGERMGAALAVRLALLKSLSNCDFVFLDEPTQNMDEIRREKLSQEIMKIRGFKQVFVISHDDTFNEKYAHVVKIQKIDGESRVVE